MADIQVPQIGESITSGILAVWLKKEGEQVQEGEEVFELETDKATMAVPSPAAGVLHTAASEGDEVVVGQVVGTIDPAGTGVSPTPTGNEAAPTPSPEKSVDVPLSPAVRRVVAEHNIDPATLKGTGPGGRITKADALAATGSAPKPTPGTPAPAAPVTAAPARPAPLAAPSMPTNELQRREPMTTLRKRIAENLVHSKQHSAHVTTFNEVDMSAVMAMRAEYKDAFQEKHGVRLGFMSFFVKASQTALQEMPGINAYLDGTDLLFNDYVNIGVALSSEKGLLTPVIKDVARKGFADIEAQIVDFIARANNKRLKPDEMVGATFTISNGGVFGSLLSTPIPSPPQTAVMGMHTIQKRPVVVDDQIVIRPMMYLALTYDHRVVDGREAVTFLGRVKSLVEAPAQLLLGL